MLEQVGLLMVRLPTMSTTQAFRSDIRPLLRLCAKLAIYAIPLLVVAAAIGQMRKGRFPVYGDLASAALIAVAAIAALALLMYLATLAFKVTVLAEGLRCYDPLGVYHTVKWEDIMAVERAQLYGLPYLMVKGKELSQPLTLPLWLQDMARFRSAVDSSAGHQNILSKALHEAT